MATFETPKDEKDEAVPTVAELVHVLQRAPPLRSAKWRGRKVFPAISRIRVSRQMNGGKTQLPKRYLPTRGINTNTSTPSTITSPHITYHHRRIVVVQEGGGGGGNKSSTMSKLIHIRHGGFIAIFLLTGLSIVNANTSIMPLASRGPASAQLAMAKSKSSAFSSVVDTTSTTITDLVAPSTTTTKDAGNIPRGGGGGGGLRSRLKVGSYFALWYILNIIYNSKF